jgi:hypothetical protein
MPAKFNDKQRKNRLEMLRALATIERLNGNKKEARIIMNKYYLYTKIWYKDQ